MKIGILGGTFNPIHSGHLRLAEEVFGKLKLDKLIFVPACTPPHKSHVDIIAWQDRYRMTELAVKKNPSFEVSDIEKKRNGPSYSIDTVRELKGFYGGAPEIFFITGSDSIDELDSWKDIEALKDISSFVIATRPHYGTDDLPRRTIAVEVDTPNISSRDIRRRIKENKPFKELLPVEVYNYIIKRRLYL